MEFINCLQDTSNITRTANGLKAYKSTLNANLDFFSSISSLRNIETKKITQDYSECLKEDKLLAFKLAFYARSIRHLGQGERKLARKLYAYLANNETDSMLKNMHLIPYYGRFDDLYALDGTLLEKEMYRFMYEQAINDLNSTSPSLLGKWLISANTKSNKKSLGIKTAKYFAYFKTNNEQLLHEVSKGTLNTILKDYRKLLTTLRKKINILETKLCSQDYQSIDFSKVPSMAMLRYCSTFTRNANEQYEAYLEQVRQGKAKINTQTLTPYDIFSKIECAYSASLETLWKNLPDYVNGGFNTLVVADTSGSMEGKPMDVALSLAIYFAEHNYGPYHNKMITFSRNPHYVTFSDDDNLLEKYRKIPEYVENTNINKVFKLILNTAIENNLKDEDLPRKVLIISDMQFDACTIKNKDYYTELKAMFAKYNYTLPELIFWNVSEFDYCGKYQVKYDTKGAILISGMNPSLFESIMKSVDVTPLKFMNEVLNNPYFDLIQI